MSLKIGSTHSPYLAAATDNFRAARIEIYADWLAHDADGLAYNISNPATGTIADATTILANARAKLAGALELIDKAIAADKAAHNPEHS